jgi:hypothetical protein
MEKPLNTDTMAQFDREAHSFVIRIWKENSVDPTQTAVWRGWIRHVQSEKQHYFSDMAEINRVVVRYLETESGINAVFEPAQGQTVS